jgi:hypothetical protein
MNRIENRILNSPENYASKYYKEQPCLFICITHRCILINPASLFATDLWVWNAPRNGFPGSPRNQDVRSQQLLLLML